MRATRIMANLRVADVEAAKSFYTDYLGLSTEEFTSRGMYRERSISPVREGGQVVRSAPCGGGWCATDGRWSVNEVSNPLVVRGAEAAATGWARLPWDVVGEEGEDLLAQSAATVRCLQRADGTVPERDDEPDLVAFVARSY